MAFIFKAFINKVSLSQYPKKEIIRFFSNKTNNKHGSQKFVPSNQSTSIPKFQPINDGKVPIHKYNDNSTGASKSSYNANDKQTKDEADAKQTETGTVNNPSLLSLFDFLDKHKALLGFLISLIGGFTFVGWYWSEYWPSTYRNSILGALNKTFVPKLPAFSGPTFERQEWKTILSDFLSGKLPSILSVYGASGSGKSTAILKSLKDAKMEGVIYIYFRDSAFLSAIKRGISYPSTTQGNGHDLDTVLGHLEAAVQMYYQRTGSPALIVFDDIHQILMNMTEKDTKLVASLLNKMVKLQEQHVRILFCSSDYLEAKKLPDVPGVSGLASRMKEFLFPLVSDEELKTGLTALFLKDQQRKLTDGEINGIIENIGSQFTELEVTIKDPDIPGGIKKRIEEAKHSLEKDVFSYAFPLNYQPTDADKTLVYNGQRFAHVLYTHFAKEKKFPLKSTHVVNFGLPGVSSKEIEMAADWLVCRNFISYTDSRNAIPYSRSRLAAYKELDALPPPWFNRDKL